MINSIKICSLSLLLLLNASARDPQKDDCEYKGFKLYGKVQIVESFPDLKAQVVNAFPDLKVQLVEHFADDCGEWKIVEDFPDIKVQFVNAFPDIKIQFVNAFPGRTNTKIDP